MRKEIKWRPLPHLQPIGRESEIELLRRHNNNLGMRIADLERALSAIAAECERQGETEYTYEIGRTARAALLIQD